MSIYNTLMLYLCVGGWGGVCVGGGGVGVCVGGCNVISFILCYIIV